MVQQKLLVRKAIQAMRLSPFVQHLATLVGTSIILLFFSEYYFFNEGPVKGVVDGRGGDILILASTILELILFYAIFAYFLLGGLYWFSVRTSTDLFLIGALVGWATEGIIIPVVYEAVPISIIWPSVAWHSLVDVLLGWYLIRRVMRLNRPHYSIIMFTLLGAIWGAWVTWFWADPEGLQPLVPADFTFFAFLTATIWALGMLLVDYAGTTTFRIGRWEGRLVFAFSGVMALLMAGTMFPFSLVIIPFIWLTVRALRRPRNVSSKPIAVYLTPKPAWWQYPLTLLMPLTASMIYPLFYNANQGLPSEDVIFTLVLGGTIWLLIAWRRGFRKAHENILSLANTTQGS